VIVLDTDVFIDVLRRYQPALDWLGNLGEEELVIPGFVVMELIQGCRNRREQQRIERALQPYSVDWPSSETCNDALTVFARYYLSHGVGIIDALIGQMAVTLGAPLCTFNQRHYGAIPNLETIQPYEKPIQG
jgi:predicted nucleic acid-binding protein